MNAPLTMAELLRATAQLLRSGALRSFAALVLLTLAGTLIDAGPLPLDLASAANLPLSIATVVVQYHLTRAALRDAGVELSSKSGFGSLFMMGIVSGLAIALGFVFLIVPGVFLVVRWWVAAPVLLASEGGISDALGESWRETEGSFWPIFSVLGLIWLPALAGVAATVIVTADDQTRFAASLLINLLVNLALILGWHAAVAGYLICRRSGELDEIFA